MPATCPTYSLAVGTLCWFNSVRGPVLCRITAVTAPGTLHAARTVNLTVERSTGAYDKRMTIPATSEVWCIPQQALKRDGVHIRPYCWA